MSIVFLNVRSLVESGATSKNDVLVIAECTKDYFLKNGLFVNSIDISNRPIDIEFTLSTSELTTDGMLLAKQGWLKYIQSLDKNPDKDPRDTKIMDKYLKKIHDLG